MRTTSGSLSGLLKRPGTAAPAPAGASPLFEVHGAAMLPPEPPTRPATAAPAAPQGRTAVQSQQHKVAAPAYNVHARAANSRPATATCASPPVVLSPHRQASPAAVASHGLDPSTSPVPQAAASIPHYQQPLRRPGVPVAPHAMASSAAAAPQQRQVSQQQQPAQREQQHAQGGAFSRASSLGSSAGSSSLPSTSGDYGSSSSQGGAPPAVMHQNPLYAGGSDSISFGGSRQQAAQPQARPPPVRVAPPAAATPATPPASVLAGMAGVSASPTPTSNLQAASNLTMLTDSRPISPGPFLSTLPSGSERGSRPVSPQCIDSVPPTPGSFAPPGVAAAAAAVAASRGVLSPIRTASSAALTASQQSRSLPTSPAPPAAASLPVAGGSPSACPAGMPSATAAFRVPIFNQDGRLVGYKQNSNLIPRPGACISSAPSSPSRSAYLADPTTIHTFQTTSFSAAGAVEGASPQPKPPVVRPPASDSGDFAEYLVDPFKGFPDADNMVPGYVLGPVLGKGGFCSVRKALHELTGQAVACKIIEKGKLKDPKDRDRVDRECRVMRNLSNHCAVIKLFEYVETRDCVYIMMEAAKRGSLLDYVRERKRLPEPEAVRIFQQLLHSLQFCHRKDVVHRDIKLENILIDGAGHMKLIDFGLCGYYVAGKRLRCHCGSPSYAAPEIVARKDYLGPPVDVWSLGIVLFAMLAGYLPFHAKEKKQLSEKILAGVYKPAAWMSLEAQDLLSRMLCLDPEQRITLEGVWAHPWVASAPRWEPPGVGAGRLYRCLTDPTTGAVLPDEAVMAQLEALGADTAAIRRALRSRECNSLTATYHLQLEAHLEAQRAAAAREREAAAERAAAAAAAKRAVEQQRGACSSADWQWDFAAISAHAAAAERGQGAPSSSQAAPSSPVAGGSGSSSLRGSSSPARLRVAVAPPAGSPTRFGVEAAAAGYVASPRRPATSGAATPTLHFGGTPFSSPPLAQAPAPSPQRPEALPPALVAAEARPRQADSEPFTIKALHAPPGSGEPSVSTPVAAAAAGAELAATPALITSSAVTTTTAVVDGEGPTSPSKSPRLAPLPAVLSPKQLAGVGAPGTTSAGEHSPPLAQAV